MGQFANLNGTILPKPKGFDYDLINGKLYDLKGFYSPTLFENGDFNLPVNIYETEKDKKFRRIVLKGFEKSDKTMGVLLHGEKGTGKSIQAKLIAKESNLPIINIPSDISKDALIAFFKAFDTPVCVIFDEFDKYFDTRSLLPLLDGIEKTAKMLCIFTCNDINSVSEYLLDRCSRIRYTREFTFEDNQEFIPEIIKEFSLIDKETELTDYCKESIACPTVDNVRAFISEYKTQCEEYPDSTPSDVAEFLNITLK